MTHPVRAWLLVVAVSLTHATASADPHWYRGAAGRRRLLHLGGAVLGGALYISSETFLKSTLAPASCRWCEPTSFDASIRNAIHWSDPAPAVTASSIAGFVVAPTVVLGLTMLASSDAGGDRIARWLDDTIPIVEAGVYAGMLNQLVKFSVGEQRPFVHFNSDPTRTRQLDDNLSFYSGHATLTFALATSAGVVAHERHYKLEPLIWAAGYTIAATTAYLRLAGDEHYMTDVVAGALLGTGFGLGVPLLMHREVLAGHQVDIVPTGTGIAATGVF